MSRIRMTTRTTVLTLVFILVSALITFLISPNASAQYGFAMDSRVTLNPVTITISVEKPSDLSFWLLATNYDSSFYREPVLFSGASEAGSSFVAYGRLCSTKSHLCEEIAEGDTVLFEAYEGSYVDGPNFDWGFLQSIEVGTFPGKLEIRNIQLHDNPAQAGIGNQLDVLLQSQWGLPPAKSSLYLVEMETPDDNYSFVHAQSFGTKDFVYQWVSTPFVNPPSGEYQITISIITDSKSVEMTRVLTLFIPSAEQYTINLPFILN